MSNSYKKRFDKLKNKVERKQKRRRNRHEVKQCLKEERIDDLEQLNIIRYSEENIPM